jgi:oleandomycin transport system ATP-binding protein
MSDTAAVKEILGGVATDRAPIDEYRPGEYSVPVADDSALAIVVAKLAAQHVTVTELSLQLPSLDEVFFTLTGQRQRPSAEDAAAVEDQEEKA